MKQAVRLNEHLRRTIVRAAKAKASVDRQRDLDLREAAIFEEIVRRVLGPVLWRRYNETPRIWFSAPASLAVKVAGEVNRIQNTASMRIPENLERVHIFEREADPEFCDLMIALWDDSKAFAIDMAKFEGQTRAVVESVNTVDALLEIWPECRELLPSDALNPKRRLPVSLTAIAELNRVAGLPTLAVAA